MSYIKPILYWLRHDLRLADNPALLGAAAKGPVAALYVLDDTLPHAIGGASRFWLHHSLQSLQGDLAQHGVPLIIRNGAAKETVPRIAEEIGAQAVYWNRVYEPAAIKRDTEIKTLLKNKGIETESFNGALLHEPWTIKNKEGNPFRVFTPYAKTCIVTGFSAPSGRPKSITGAPITLPLGALTDLNLLPTRPDWSAPLKAVWTFGEKAAANRLQQFIDEGLAHYALGRDRPDKPFVSRLSPHLHFGEISPRQALQAATLAAEQSAGKSLGTQRDKFLSELLWREFSHHLLFAFPDLPEQPLNKKFSNFPWAEDEGLFKKWAKGQTGFPIIDAGMRQLWQEGWMHNRVRMITASFLIKNLLQPWQKGEAWFWDTLVDADLANNTASWQWVAGCGADAAPYFRIFNPVLQGKKFDPDGDYVRRYVPELKNLPARVIHAPWEAQPLILADSGVELGKNYPKPMVDLAATRTRALEAFARIKEE